MLATRVARCGKRFLLIGLLASIPAVTAEKDIVYLSATGSKYHRQTCRTLKKKPTSIERKKAEESGYAACKICRP